MPGPAMPSDEHVMTRARRAWLRSRLSLLWFELRAHGLRLQRGTRNVVELVRTRPVLAQTPEPALDRVLAESVSSLWSQVDADGEQALTIGKIHNLRIAAARLDGQSIAVGAVFSFWRVVGAPTRRRGFVSGRELREGCMIASVGGGLCQLSNALYAVALQAGLEIVERHPHSQVVPGSSAERGRDATVFWNYIDLRFRSTLPLRIEATLSRDQLVVRLYSAASPSSAPRLAPRVARSVPFVMAGATPPDDCARCDQQDCVQHVAARPTTGVTALLLDQQWPEFDRWLGAASPRPGLALVPIDGSRRRRPNYAWSVLREPQWRVVEHRWLALRRSLVSRLFGAQGAQRQRQLLALDEAFARAYARAIPITADRLVVPIHLLAALHRCGALGGRSVSVLMSRAPLAMLQRDLDRAAALHPQSPTLADFRADARQLDAEARALDACEQWVTPHAAVAAYLAAQAGTRLVKLDWCVPAAPAHRRGKRILFPASALGRKGAYELREACASLGLSLSVLGAAAERPGFWAGIDVVGARSSMPFEDIGCVVLPAFVEHRPGMLLAALARDIPVVCTPECGLPSGLPGLCLVPGGDAQALTRALMSHAPRS